MSQKKILIVDDETLIRRSLADYLEECGYATVMASDGTQGLQAARKQKFDAVLVDLRMPHVDGLEVIATLKEEQPELPVVVVSGTGVLNDAVEAMRRGAWDYVTKPIQDLTEIAVVVDRVLERARLVAERDQYQRDLERLNRSLEAEVARQTQDLRTQNRELAALNSIAYAISNSIEIETMLTRAMRAAISALEADGAIARLLNPTTRQLLVTATASPIDLTAAATRPIPFGHGIAGQVAQTGHIYVGPPPAAPPGDVSQATDSYICVPLRAGDEVVGTLEIWTHSNRSFVQREVELISVIGNQIGVAVTRIRYAADLQQANIELRRLDTLREQFIQNVAHELRTPLGLVSGYIEMLVHGGLGAEEQQMALDVAWRRVQALVKIVESITTLQDLGSQSLQVASVGPNALVNTALKMSQQRASSAGIELYNRCPTTLPSVSGDFTRLVQALHQIIDNACKFSEQGTVVTVDAQTNGENLSIVIVDQGLGIPPEEHEHIFERFYQVDGSTSRRFGGTGLGLAIAKEIVKAHGGTIRVDSEGVAGRGSTFTVNLPIQA